MGCAHADDGGIYDWQVLYYRTYLFVLQMIQLHVPLMPII